MHGVQPCKKNTVVFQNSYTASEQYLSGWHVDEVKQVGMHEWQWQRTEYDANRNWRRGPYRINGTDSPGGSGGWIPEYSTRTVTRWNTKWRKLNA